MEAGVTKESLDTVMIDQSDEAEAIRYYEYDKPLNSLRWYIYFDAPVAARFIKITVTAYHQYPSMRAGVLVESSTLQPEDWVGKSIVAYKY